MTSSVVTGPNLFVSPKILGFLLWVSVTLLIHILTFFALKDFRYI